MKNKQTKIALCVIFLSLFVFSSIRTCISIQNNNEDMNIKGAKKKDRDLPEGGWIEEHHDKPKGKRFTLFEEFGGFWADAEKIPHDDGPGEPSGLPGTDDDEQCWAATASNMLEWTGWGFVEGSGLKFGNTDNFFDHYNNYAIDKSCQLSRGLRMWFDGIKGSMAKRFHDGFYKSINPNSYINSYEFHKPQAASIIKNNLRVGRAVGLLISDNLESGGHIITCWGFNYDERNDNIKGIWVSNSDSDKTSNDAPNVLTYYEIKYDRSKNCWKLPNYEFNPKTRYIRGVYTLKRFPGAFRPVAKINVEYEGFRQFTFDASDSYNPHGGEFKYRWDFDGDGNFDTFWSISPTITHTYDGNDPNVVKVYLEVFDGRLRDIDTMKLGTRPYIIPPIGPIHPIHPSFTSPSL